MKKDYRAIRKYFLDKKTSSVKAKPLSESLIKETEILAEEAANIAEEAKKSSKNITKKIVRKKAKKDK